MVSSASQNKLLTNWLLTQFGCLAHQNALTFIPNKYKAVSRAACGAWLSSLPWSPLPTASPPQYGSVCALVVREESSTLKHLLNAVSGTAGQGKAQENILPCHLSMFRSVSCMSVLVQQILKVDNNSCYLQTCSAVAVAGVVTVIICSFHSNKVMQSCRVFCTALVVPLLVLCIFPRNVTFIYDQTTLFREEMKVSVNSVGTCPSQGELRQWVSSSFLACRHCGLIAFCLVETKSRCLLLQEARWLLLKALLLFVFAGMCWMGAAQPGEHRNCCLLSSLMGAFWCALSDWVEIQGWKGRCSTALTVEQNSIHDSISLRRATRAACLVVNCVMQLARRFSLSPGTPLIGWKTDRGYKWVVHH